MAFLFVTLAISATLFVTQDPSLDCIWHIYWHNICNRVPLSAVDLYCTHFSTLCWWSSFFYSSYLIPLYLIHKVCTRGVTVLILCWYDYMDTSMLAILVNKEYICKNLEWMVFLMTDFRVSNLLWFVVMNIRVTSYFQTTLFPNHFRKCD